jgi:hypothetical protein
MREPVELQLTGSVSGATRPRLDSWLGYCGGFDSLALEWNRRQPPGCRRPFFDPCSALCARIESVGRAKRGSKARSATRETDDSVFGVGELQSVPGVCELHSIRVRRCAPRIGRWGEAWSPAIQYPTRRMTVRLAVCLVPAGVAIRKERRLLHSGDRYLGRLCQSRRNHGPV